MSRRRTLLRAACFAAASALAPVLAQDKPIQLAELADLSLEQLAQVTVTSAARREQPLLEAPASLFVISAEDIRRSGFTSLAEVLRMAPNLQVMRGDTSQYVISARGGLTTTANKWLVLVDGRPAYTPPFSGVFYAAMPLRLEEADGIGVISGPGATMWGTNAVNGVINITTRNAGSTLGTLLSLGAGDLEAGASVRHGWRVGANTAMRAYARYFDRDAHRLEAGGSALDEA